MSQPNAPTEYTSVAKLLHWLIALGILGMLVLGFYMGDLPKGPDRMAMYQLHKSIGIVILLLAFLRLVWRLTHVAPPLPVLMKAWEKFAAYATHTTLYLLIFGIPLTGWALVSASPMNLHLTLFNTLPWPLLPLEPNKEVSHLFGEIHSYLADFLIGLLVLHGAAAIKHHFIDRDEVMIRMAPRSLTGFLNRLRKKD